MLSTVRGSAKCPWLLKKAFLSTSTQIIARHTKQIPVRLFRLSNANKRVVIREKKAQHAKGLYSYDYTASSEGMMEPAPLSNTFIGPNGLSLRPAGRVMYELVTMKKGNTVIDFPENTEIPEGLVLLHEHSDHYSLQPSRLMKPADFIALVKAYVKPFANLSQNEYAAVFPYEEG